MVFKCTLCVRVNRVCEGKSREDIVSEVAKAFSQPLVAVQIGSDSIHITFQDVESYQAAHANTRLYLWYQLRGPGSGPYPHHGPQF